ncbi:hypothetical protein Mal64_02490 [Pseudobythopirellula maris]|uniref:Ice-binding protein C-terminal domain-containing protein n=1 Tax=Pseudobythopirellula maris TaxID=2527991 RepID=A0A5C5ZSC3_9BACT|nr:PEP-CTERM sorting domain-containing protein [Pseudobythopirellula maris]TWT89867.1 hypothetical protein Mal64_02490 [Pseudobythopirellula maris]
MTKITQYLRTVAAAVALTILLATTAHAQLIVTEIMADPGTNTSSSDPAWEWIELWNNTDNAIDFSATPYVIDDDDADADNDFNSSTYAQLSQPNLNVGVIPAGGIAVLYNQFELDDTYDGDYQFEDAWGTQNSQGQPITYIPFTINDNPSAGSGPVDYNFLFPGLSNSDDQVGLWSSYSAYSSETPLNGPGSLADDFTTNNTVSGVYYGDPPTTRSVQWRGVGDFKDFNNWVRSEPDVAGAVVTNVIAEEGEGVLNGTDFGSPGITHGTGAAPAGELVITEIMMDPNFSDFQWEWIEVHNNTGAAIDFGSTPYVFDDFRGNDLTEANITSGVIPDGSTAVLFNEANSDLFDLANDLGENPAPDVLMERAWGSGINFIPVSTWSSLNNLQGETSVGDKIGIWSSLADYEAEPNDDPDPTGDEGETVRTFDNATVVVEYEFGQNGWDDYVFNSGTSIYLEDLSFDPSDPASWGVSGDGPDLFVGYPAASVEGDLIIYPADDTGSPGLFLAQPILVGDYNDNGVVDAADFTVWRDNFETDASLPNRDPGLSGDISMDDYAAWVANFGETLDAMSNASSAAVPEPAALAVLAMGLAGLVSRRRR